MAAEGASYYLGPRYAYAPPDPTLPKPWISLIDGRLGLIYYWNTETNITQYEKPTAVPLPVSAPWTEQPVGIPGQQARQFSTPEQRMLPQQGNNIHQPHQGVNLKQSRRCQFRHNQPMHHMGYRKWPSQHLQHFTQQQDNRAAFPQDGPLAKNQRSDVNYVQTPVAHNGPLVKNQPSGVYPVQIPLAQNGPLVKNQLSDVNTVQTPLAQNGSFVKNQPSDVIPVRTRPAQNGPLVQNRPSDFNPVQTPPAQNVPLVKNQSSDINAAQTPPAQNGPFVKNQPSDVNPIQTPPAQNCPLVKNQPSAVNPIQTPPAQNGPLVENQPSAVNPIQTPPAQNDPLVKNQTSDVNPIQIPPTQNCPLVQNQPSDVNPVQTQPTSQFNMQQLSLFGQLQQSSVDDQQHGPMFQKQNVPPVGSNKGFEDNPPDRGGNDHYSNAKNGGPDMVPHQPQLAAIPMAKNHQETNSADQNVSHALPGGPTSHNMQVQANGGPPVINYAMVRANPAVMAFPDAVTLSSVDIYRQKHDITTTGDDVPAPFMSFESTGLPPELLREIYAAGFASPTPIQAQTWPIALQNRDIVAIAKTGSGRTLGYLIPAFMLLRRCNNNRQHGPTVVVLAPTKELATQIQDEALKFGQFVRISCTCLYGGAPEGPQLKDLERGAHIVVASPRRLNEIIEMRKLDFRQVSLLVLDEADRMLDMGFEPQIRKIFNEMPPRTQTLMYTATWPKEVRKIASDLLDNAVQVNIGNADELAANKSITQVHIGNADELAANKAITQYLEVVPHMEKQRRVEQILRSEERASKIIIFCSTTKLCDQLSCSISGKFRTAAIHGEKFQDERDSVLNQFHSGKVSVLVVTDVVTRGLDIKGVRVVINYDFPNGVEDYVHRIGLTGRAGAKGVAYTFFSEQDWKHAADLIKVLEEANQPVPDEVREIARRGGPSFGKDSCGMCHFDPGRGGGHWDCGRGRGRSFGVTRDDGSRGCGGGSGGPGRGNMRDDRFGGCDGGFGGRGGMRDNGGGRNCNFGGRRGRKGVGFGGPNGGWDGSDKFKDSHGGGCGHGSGRFDNSRYGDNSRGRSYSRSHSRSRSRSRRYIRSRSRSWSRSQSRSRTPVRRERSRESIFDDRRDGDRSRGRTYSRSRSRSLSHSRSPWQSRNRSRTPVRRDRRRESRFDSRRNGVRSRGRSYSRSRSCSRSWSRSLSSRRSRSRTPVRHDRRRDGDRSRGRNYYRSRSFSRSQSRSWSSKSSRSRGRSWSHSRSPRRSRSCTPVRRERRRESKFDQKEPDLPAPLKSEGGPSHPDKGNCK